MSNRRVVVTGLGTVNPLGFSVQDSWNKLINSKSGISKIESFDVTNFETKIAGEIKWNDIGGDFNPTNYIEFKEIKKMSKYCVYGMAAAQEAIKDAGIETQNEEELEKIGVLIGSGIGGIEAIAKNTLKLYGHESGRISPFFLPSVLINMVSGNVSIKYGFKGPNHSVVTACATGNHAIGDAANIIKYGMADVMVAGGAEGAVCGIAIAGFNALTALSTNFNDTPEKASRPWDIARDGFVMGEGAGVLVLEEYEHAKKRGAKIYCEIAGYGMSGDANHMTAPDAQGNGGYRAMKMAMERGNINPNDINYINAHGTSTPLGDLAELRAYKKMLGDRISQVPISSTKSATGHLLGGAGAIEAVFSIKAIETGIAPPTLNLENPDEECTGINLVPLIAQEHKISTVISNSFGFGGTNATLIFKK